MTTKKKPTPVKLAEPSNVEMQMIYARLEFLETQQSLMTRCIQQLSKMVKKEPSEVRLEC